MPKQAKPTRALPGPDEPFVLVRDAAAILGADERTIRRAIADGHIPAVRLGRTVRIPTAWLLAAASGEASPAQAPGLRVVHGLAERRAE